MLKGAGFAGHLRKDDSLTGSIEFEKVNDFADKVVPSIPRRWSVFHNRRLVDYQPNEKIFCQRLDEPDPRTEYATDTLL